MRLGVSPAATSTPTGVFNQWFEALFPCCNSGLRGLSPRPPAAASLASCSFTHPAPQSATSLGLPAATLWGLLAVAWPVPFHNPPPHWVRQLPPCRESSLPQLPVSAPPTNLDECYFFISLFVRLPYSSIFCQFWLFFVFKFVVVLLLVVRGGTVCLPTTPSWPELQTISFLC